MLRVAMTWSSSDENVINYEFLATIKLFTTNRQTVPGMKSVLALGRSVNVANIKLISKTHGRKQPTDI